MTDLDDPPRSEVEAMKKATVIVDRESLEPTIANDGMKEELAELGIPTEDLEIVPVSHYVAAEAQVAQLKDMLSDESLSGKLRASVEYGVHVPGLIDCPGCPDCQPDEGHPPHADLASEIGGTTHRPPPRSEVLPAELVRILRDPSIVIERDSEVFNLISSWVNAPSNTVSAGPSPSRSEDGITYIAFSDHEAALAAARQEAEAAEARVKRLEAALREVVSAAGEFANHAEIIEDSVALPDAQEER